MSGEDVVSFDEDGNPVLDVRFSFPDDPKGFPADRRSQSRLAERIGASSLNSLTETQADAGFSYISYGHYFGRSVFLRNSYAVKDMIGRAVAAHVSAIPLLSAAVIAWDDERIRLETERPSVTTMTFYHDVYKWAIEVAIALGRGGFLVTIEDFDEVE